MLRATVLLLLAPMVMAQVEVDVTDLDTHPDQYEGTRVVITGEVVGDYGIRSDVVWIQLNTDVYADTPLRTRDDAVGSNVGIGVRYPRALHNEEWGPPGGYGVRGPILRVEGVFRYNDDEESGETFIDADTIEVMSPSLSMGLRDPDIAMWIAAIIAALGGAALYGSARLRRRPLG